jgi:outer membrane receptor protein involved in Fe transport
LHLGFVFRVDKNDYFQATSNPRITALYTWNDRQSIRIAYQEGFRFPSIFEAYSNINSGGVKRVGGLPVMSSGVFESAYLTSSITAFQAAVLSDMNKNGLSKAQAIATNKALLIKNPYTYIQPEQIKSWELGYRGALVNNRLVVDADFYYNQYQHFIAQTNVNVPKTSVLDSIPLALYDKTTQTPYRVWTNSNSIVSTYGFSMGMQYRSASKWSYSGNVTYSKLAKSEQDDGLEDGFNTPDWVVNVGISNPHFMKQWGGSVNYRWQNAYYSQSFLISDWVSAYGSLDLSLSYQVKASPILLKASATNVLNRPYYSFAGGPQIGAMYLLAVSLNAL